MIVSECPTFRFAAVTQLLEKSAAANSSAYGGFAIWTFLRKKTVNTTLGGLLLVVPPAPKKCCCPTTARAGNPALLIGSRGEQPVDGTRYSRLHWRHSAPKLPDGHSGHSIQKAALVAREAKDLQCQPESSHSSQE